MGGLVYHDLVEVDLGKLGSAVADWKSAVEGLQKLMDDANSGLLKKSEGARWAGLNADVTRTFVKKTAKEFADLHKEAHSVWSILDDAHSQLTEIQSTIRSAVAQAQEIKLQVADNYDGTVKFVYPLAPEGTYSKRDREVQQEYIRHVNAKLARAIEIDGLVKGALAKIHGGDVYDAGHTRYNSLNDVAVERALTLASFGKDANAKQRAELRKLWDGLSPELRGRLWDADREKLMAAGVISPTYKWTPGDKGNPGWAVRDPGAGDRWNLFKAKSEVELDKINGLGQAGRNLEHYLSNTGTPLDLDVDSMLRDDRPVYEDVEWAIVDHQEKWAEQARKELEKSGAQTVTIPVETKGQDYLPADPGWREAVGSGTFNVSGAMTAKLDEYGKPQYYLDYQVNVWDRYSWNESKDNWPGDVTDPDMAHLQTVGLAQDFDMRGSSSVTHYDYQQPGPDGDYDGPGPQV
ncbi:hypothetical protein [Streptomyces sp. ME19-01-6]|uniref:hypothetical protein n=1 Tax=Streptomyces sp. ME19-01-6 TaxID=3028686 RepID=UPI0029BD5DBE|nr:hypothetical protein [Streptomyces sp. ME19-01-6]MDX3224761.1 hypothetical protein [Streptomyces sp. ME19-01-6]